MNTWLTPMCQWHTTDETILGIICVVLAALLLIGIALGFGPLGTWLGMDAGRSYFARRPPNEASGLLATWRLYRRLRRGDLFSMPDVPSGMVPDSIAEGTRHKPPTSGPTTSYHWIGYR